MKYLIMLRGERLGIIYAKNYEEVLSRIEEVVTIEEEEE
jgi:hypothetical protein